MTPSARAQRFIFDTERVLNTMCVAKVVIGVHTGLVVVVDTQDRAKSESKTPTEDWTEFVPAEIVGLVLQESNIVFGMGKPARWLKVIKDPLQRFGQLLKQNKNYLFVLKWLLPGKTSIK